MTLSIQLGESSVFMDVDSIALGRDFRSILQKTLGTCDLMLVIIDKDWAKAGGAGLGAVPSDGLRLGDGGSQAVRCQRPILGRCPDQFGRRHILTGICRKALEPAADDAGHADLGRRYPFH